MDTATVKVRAARLSVASNTGLVLLKVFVGITTRSVSILAEGIHSGVDLVAAVIALFAVRVSDQPPDEAHAYGHGKYENISGIVEALLIVGAAVFVAYESIRKLYNPEMFNPGIGIIVMGLSAVTNWVVSANLFRVARETDSIALEADGHHLRLDVYTSLAIFTGLLVVLFTRDFWPGALLIDPILGLAVAGWIAWIGLQLSGRALGPLLDLQLPAAEVERISTIIHEDERVKGFHKLRTRKAGAHRHVDVHLIVPKDLSVIQAHDLAEEVEDKVRAEFDNVSIVTHVEPEDEGGHRV